MNIQLIADSCCDVTPAMCATLGLQTAALKITIDGDKHYIDEPGLNMKKLLAEMKASKNPVATAAPSPEAYAQLMRQGDAAVVVTLSAKLSGSYNSAIAARDIVLEEEPERKIFVFDSKAASAAQLRIVIYIHKLITEGASFEELVEKVPPFIDGLTTLFVLEDLGNLIKNGRIPKMAGMIGTMLMLRPIMGVDGHGEIIPLEKIRGTAKALERLVAIVAERTKAFLTDTLVMTLSYCNCLDRATEMKKKFLAACPAIREIIMAPTGGIATCYANDGGIVVSFA